MSKDNDTLKTYPIRAWDWPKIAVFVPLFPALPFADDVFHSFVAIAQQGVPFLKIPYGRADFVRNKAASGLLESDYTHVCMLDADHAHPPDIVQRLARWVLQDKNKLVVGGLNFKRREPFDPCCFIKIPGEDNKYGLPDKWSPGIMEVDIIGTGCILISREVFEAIEKPFFYYPYTGAETDDYPTEDVGFSLNCQKAGVKMWVDTTTTSPHMTTGKIDQNTYKRYWELHPDTDKELIPAGG